MIFRKEVRWEFLRPQEFLERQAKSPVVYLPMGLCEPHGHIAPFGLDTIKADWICDEAAHQFGGIVVPTMTYHTHETGYHAPWLKEVMGGVNPRLAALPPHLVLEIPLYQFRAFLNAGFKAVVVIIGHHGSQEDLRMVAEAFSSAFPLQHFVRTDPELVSGQFTGDHAGRYELSQPLAIRPDLVAMDRAGRVTGDGLGRFAQNPDVAEATAEEGQEILRASLISIGKALLAFRFEEPGSAFIEMDELEPVWTAMAGKKRNWRTSNP